MNKAFRVATVFLLVFLLAFSQPLLVIAKNSNTPPGQDKKTNTPPASSGSGGTKTVATTTITGVSTTYGFEVQDLTLNGSYSTDQIINTDIIIKNTSNFPWSKSDVDVAYHWIDGNGQYEVYRGNTTKLSSDLAVNEIISQKMQIRAPSIPGVFNLSIDLIKGDTWFTAVSYSKYFKEVTITGSVNTSDTSFGMSINDNAEFTNNPILSVEVTPYSDQPGSDNAAFIYDYAQATDASKENIENGTAKWSNWELISNPWDKSKIKATLTDQSVGMKRLYVRYRAFKKQSAATPEDYGSAEYHYGRSEKTTGAYYADEIFFDNVSPIGGVEINNGDYSTTSRTGNLHIWASDEVNGVMGSGLNGMRWTNNCNLTDLNANSWSEWENDIVDKNGIDLGTGTNMVVCVQFRDKAGNVGTFSDSIWFVQYSYSSGTGSDPSNIYSGFIYGIGIGTPEDPFGNITSNDFKKPWIAFDRFIRYDGATKWNVVKDKSGIPAPIITFVQRVDDKHIKISGVGVRKNNPIDVIVNNEYRYCTLCGSGWEWFKEGRTLQNVKVVLYKEDGTVIQDNIWNDDSNGQWQSTLELNDNLKETDKFYAKIFIYDSYPFENLHWWVNTIEGTVNFETWTGNDWGISTDKSQTVGVPYMVDMQKAFIKAKYLLDVIDGSSLWSTDELTWTTEILNDPNIEQLFNSNTLNSMRKDVISSGNSCDNTGGISQEGVLGVYKYDCKSYSVFDSLYTLDVNKYGPVSKEELFKINMVHELTHSYQRINSNKTNEFTSISWQNLDSSGYSQTRKALLTNCDFVTGYLASSWEDMAEVYAIHYVKPTWFMGEYNRVKDFIGSKTVFGVRNSKGQDITPPLEVCKRVSIEPKPFNPPFDQAVSFDLVQLNNKQNFNY